MTRLEPSLPALDKLEGFEALCLFVTEDERPLSGAGGFLDWRLSGAISRALKTGFFEGKPGERLLMPMFDQVPIDKLFAIGLGRTGSATALGVEHALTGAAHMLNKAQVKSTVLAFSALPGLDEAAKEELIKRAFSTAFTGKFSVFASEEP